MDDDVPIDVPRIIAALISFQCDVTPDVLAEIFGEHQREHLFLRWKRMNENALYFYGGLDMSNRMTLEKYMYLLTPRRTSARHSPVPERDAVPSGTGTCTCTGTGSTAVPVAYSSCTETGSTA